MKKNVYPQPQQKYISSVVEEVGWAGELRDLVWAEAASQERLVPTSSSPVHRTWNWQVVTESSQSAPKARLHFYRPEAKNRIKMKWKRCREMCWDHTRRSEET